MTSLRSRFFCALLPVGAWCLAFAATAPRVSASVIVLSDTRTLSASASDSSGFAAVQTDSATPLGAFNSSVAAGGAWAGMTSTLSPTDLRLQSSSNFFVTSGSYCPTPGITWARAAGETDFSVTFQVNEPTTVLLTGYRDNETLGGLIAASLSCSTGPLALNWTSAPYYNFLNQTLLLAPDTYTLTGRTAMEYYVAGNSYDGGRLQLDLALTTNVPDSGATWTLLALTVPAIIGCGRRRARPSPAR